MYTLANCRANLDMLISEVAQHRNTPGHDLYQCNLGHIYIGPDSAKIPNLHFQKGVEKIQNNNVSAMTDEEHAACSTLRISNGPNEESSSSASSASLSHKQCLERFKK